MKLATIFGLAGACRREEFSKIFTADIEDKGNLIVKGKCTKQCVGINSFGKMPSEIAAFLKLPNPELYTGHSFRCSSATLLANSDEGLTDIKRLGGRKSTTVAEGYIEVSTTYTKGLSNIILSSANRRGQTVNCKICYFIEEKSQDGTPTGRIEYNSIFSKTTQSGSKKNSRQQMDYKK
ncbi:hypothetical protein NQ317_007770 [Molorchus minor]|uniref:Tyr recombinase domain-containing protein n=1 Tax=Molorchus minor TaxID=1323400 RepID=A0ABQ9JX05_9CUCU|nr:hypothetical protein NQ317_007770 [Molorchus minor]